MKRGHRRVWETVNLITIAWLGKSAYGTFPLGRVPDSLMVRWGNFMQLIDQTQCRSSRALFLHCSREDKSTFPAVIRHVILHRFVADIALATFSLRHVNHPHNFATWQASWHKFLSSFLIYAYFALPLGSLREYLPLLIKHRNCLLAL